MNPIGQRTSVARVAGGVTGSTAWGYDGYGQVTSADDSNSSGDRTYQYDAIGNRKKSADSLTLPGSDNYASNALNQYTTIPNVPPTPTYDFDGNATAYPMPAAPAQNSLLSWDGENRLIYTSVYGTGTIVTYQYDALGRRIAQNISGTSGSTKATYVYDGWNCIAEYEGAANTLHAANLWGLELTAWWFSTVLNDEARNILAVIARHGVHPQLWVMGGGGPVKSPEEQAQRIEQECARLRPIAEAAAQLGLKVGLYNHGGWFGEPENQLAILEKLALPNVGLVYNFHHGHGEIARFRELWPKMQPHLIALNINGMIPDGDRLGRGTVTIGTGTEESWMLKIVRDSGWHGPVGLVGDRPQLDAEDALRDNLAGLEKLRPALALP